jgi:AcrR family transcriptional regulator
MARQISRRTRTSQPTKDALLATVVDLLDATPLNEVSVELVIETAGVSRSSVYYHFSDLSDLLEQALVVRFARTVDESIETLRTTFATASTAEDFRQILRSLTRITQVKDRADRRMERISAIADTANNQRFRDRLGAEQRRLTEAQNDIFTKAQHNGWIREDLDAHAVAVFVQAYTVGRVIDDIDPQPVDQEAWIRLIDHLGDSILTSHPIST